MGKVEGTNRERYRGVGERKKGGIRRGVMKIGW